MMKKRILTGVSVCVIVVNATACGGKGGDSAEVMELPAIGEEDGLSDVDVQVQGNAGGQRQTVSRRIQKIQMQEGSMQEEPIQESRLQMGGRRMQAETVNSHRPVMKKVKMTN